MPEKVVATIQARMGSSRLPGKVLLPLDCEHALSHVVTRVGAAESIDKTVVATSEKKPDSILYQSQSEFGVPIHRGSETNVQRRLLDAATDHSATVVVRVTGDCPLIDPSTIDAVVSQVQDGNAEYASNIMNRTFPRGLDVEAFSYESFERVASVSSTQREREHVTPYYRENPDEFDIVNITSDQVFDDSRFIDRTDLRLTLDEADDYQLLKRLYCELEYDVVLPIRDVIKYIDKSGLAEINEHVHQKEA
jgi:spore coat polysaccharide biosynthesis protein SpsF